MTSPVVEGEIVKKDAINRAVRTLVQGILTDVLVAIGLKGIRSTLRARARLS